MHDIHPYTLPYKLHAGWLRSKLILHAPPPQMVESQMEPNRLRDLFSHGLFLLWGNLKCRLAPTLSKQYWHPAMMKQKKKIHKSW